jgi:hypothetical protein
MRFPCPMTVSHFTMLDQIGQLFDGRGRAIRQLTVKQRRRVASWDRARARTLSAAGSSGSRWWTVDASIAPMGAVDHP